MSILFAVLSAAVFGSAVACQHHEAASAPPGEALRFRLIATLAARPLWLVGMVGDVVGFGVQTLALTVGSVVVVQPIIATNLLFALGVGALLARRSLTAAQWWAAAGCVAGVGVFLLVANPTGHSNAVAGPADWALAVGVPAVVAGGALLVGWSARGRRRAVVFGVASGLAEAVMAVLSKAFGDRLGHGVASTFRSWEPYVLVLSGVVTLLVVQSAYNVGLPTVTLPVNAIAEPLTATSIGVGVFGEHVQLGGLRGPVVAVALAVMGWSLVSLARDPTVAGWDAEPSTGGAS